MMLLVILMRPFSRAPHAGCSDEPQALRRQGYTRLLASIGARAAEVERQLTIAVARPRRSALTRHMATILHVDDEPSVGLLLEDTLTRAGHRPVSAGNVVEALQVLAR